MTVALTLRRSRGSFADSDGVVDWLARKRSQLGERSSMEVIADAPEANRELVVSLAGRRFR